MELFWQQYLKCLVARLFCRFCSLVNGGTAFRKKSKCIGNILHRQCCAVFFACKLNMRVVYTECITSASYRRFRPLYTHHSRKVTSLLYVSKITLLFLKFMPPLHNLLRCVVCADAIV